MNWPELPKIWFELTKAGPKCPGTGQEMSINCSGLTWTEMSRVKNNLYYGADFGETSYLVSITRQLDQ